MLRDMSLVMPIDTMVMTFCFADIVLYLRICCDLHLFAVTTDQIQNKDFVMVYLIWLDRYFLFCTVIGIIEIFPIALQDLGV